MTPFTVLGINQGNNPLYEYASDNPINLQDPSGLLVKICERALHGTSHRFGNFYHSFIWLNGQTYGFAPESQDDHISGPGKVWPNDPWDVNYEQHDGICTEAKCIDEAKLWASIQASTAAHEHYNIITHNCHAWVYDQITRSKKLKCPCGE